MFTRNSRDFDMEKIVIGFYPLFYNQKQESKLQQIGGLVTRNSFSFCIQRVKLFFKVIPNPINFYKKDFLTSYFYWYYSSLTVQFYCIYSQYSLFVSPERMIKLLVFRWFQVVWKVYIGKQELQPIFCYIYDLLVFVTLL